jgi:hypothetical protein
LLHRVGTWREKPNVFAPGGKLSMREKFHRHEIAAKLNRKTCSFNPL